MKFETTQDNFDKIPIVLVDYSGSTAQIFKNDIVKLKNIKSNLDPESDPESESESELESESESEKSTNPLANSKSNNKSPNKFTFVKRNILEQELYLVKKYFESKNIEFTIAKS